MVTEQIGAVNHSQVNCQAKQQPIKLEILAKGTTETVTLLKDFFIVLFCI